MSKRNTKPSKAKRNTLQMELVPTSANMALRQSDKLRAVISLRLKGAVVAAVDKVVARANEGLGFNDQLTRSKYMERAILEAVERDVGSHGPAPKAPKGRKGARA